MSTLTRILPQSKSSSCTSRSARSTRRSCAGVGVIGTGVYVDDINAAFWQWAGALSAVVTTISINLMIIASVLGRSILQPIHTLVETMNRVVEKGDLTVWAAIVQG